MSSVAVIRSKLVNYSALTNLVDTGKIVAGDIPLSTGLPAISITLVSSTPLTNMAAASSGRMNVDQVQVTVLAKTYPSLRQILALVLAACGNTRGTVAGVKVDSILPGIEGPDFSDDEVKFIAGSRDFTVKWIST